MGSLTMRALGAFVLGIAVSLLGASPARADLASAKKLLERGEYKRARAEYKQAARGAARGQALLGVAITWQRVGNYAEAAKAARRAMRVRSVAARASAMHAEMLITVGKYQAARKILERLVKRDSKAFYGRMLLGRLYRTLGLPLKAGVIWKDLYRDWDNRLMDQSKAEHAHVVGWAGWGDKNWQYAGDAFEKAVKLDGKLFRANVDWGNLFLSKYNAPDAEKSFRDVLKYDPNHADAWTGWAWVEWYAARPRRARGKKRAERALKTNPNHIEAMLFLASMAIYDKDYGVATILLHRALKVNPNHLRALSHLAAIQFLREKTAEYNKLKAKVFAINKRYSAFYYLVGVFANRHHLYKDAAALNKQAKALDPKDENALAALGIALLRIGEEGDGLFWLKEAWKIDQYNHRTLNLLNLYDEVPKKYRTVKIGHFQYRFANDEVKMLTRYVAPLMNKALQHYMTKYKYRPKKPIIVELYDSQKQFTVRTFGEPSHGGILGVCFGRVITAMSPSVGRSNWAKVLWHELAHTVHIALSRSRVPRWFTEGLAEYETIIERKYWRREHRLALYRSVTMGVAHGIKKLNLAFTHSKTAGGVVRAYFQSSQVIAFMAQRWGYKALLQSLKLFGQNKSTAQVIPIVTGMATDAFDRAFYAWVKKKYGYYKKNFDPLAGVVVPIKELERRAKAKPADPGPLAHLGIGYLLRRKLKAAKSAMKRVLTTDPNNRLGLYLKAEIAFRTRKHAAAKKGFAALLAAGHDGYLLRMRLALLERMNKNHKAALAHYDAAKKLDPERPTPYRNKLRIYARAKNKLGVVKEMEGLARLLEGSASLMWSVITRGNELHRFAQVARFGAQGIEVQPFNVDIHEKYAWALKVAGKYRKAIFEFKSALLAFPDAMSPRKRVWMRKKEAWIYLGIAECWSRLRERDRALRAVKKAQAINSNLKRAIDLRKRLDPGWQPGGGT